MGKYEAVEKEHSFKLKIHLEVLCWSIWPHFSTALSDTLLGDTLRLAGTMNNGCLSAQGPSAFLHGILCYTIKLSFSGTAFIFVFLFVYTSL